MTEIDDDDDGFEIDDDFGFGDNNDDVRLTDDAEGDIENALDLEHPDEENASCDICGARKAGFIFSAAHLLLGATETSLLYKVVKYHREDMYAGEAWPTDWNDWTKYFKENYRECEPCGAYMPLEFESCDNCLVKLPEICDCELPGEVCSGVKGILACLTNPAALDKVERCDACEIYSTDEAARVELAKRIFVYYPNGKCPDCGEEIPKDATEGYP